MNGTEVFICLLLFGAGIICWIKQYECDSMRSFHWKMKRAGDQLKDDKDEIKYCMNVMRALGASEKEVQEEWGNFQLNEKGKLVKKCEILNAR